MLRYSIQNKSMHGKTLVKMVHKSGHEMICCKLTYVNRGFQYQKKLIGFTVYSFLDHKKRFVSYFQKCRKTLAQPNEVKLKWKSTLINGDKGQKGFNKNVWKILLGKNETNVFQLCCGKGKNYVGYVGLVGKTLFWKLRWNGCRVAKERTKNENIL